MGWIVLIIILFVIILFIGWLIGIYNGLVRLRNAVRNAFSQIDVQLKRRYDLIPNLVATVKGYASHEKETLEAVTAARSRATGVQVAPQDLSDPAALQRLQQAQGELSSTLSRLLVVVEQYPDLKANQAFQDLENHWPCSEKAER